MTEPQPQSRTGRIRLVILFTAVSVAALLAGAWFSQQLGTSPAAVPEALNGTVFPRSRPVPSLALTDHNGATFDNARLKGRWSFVFFGFTHCPDVCPTTLQVLKQTYLQIQTANTSATPVQVIFVSVDPNRDTAPILKQYVQFYNPDFIGATAPLGTLTPLTRALGILYVYDTQGRSDGSYTVDHSAQILLIDPQGNWRAVFSPPHDPARIVDTFAQIRQFTGE